MILNLIKLKFCYNALILIPKKHIILRDSLMDVCKNVLSAYVTNMKNTTYCIVANALVTNHEMSKFKKRVNRFENDNKTVKVKILVRQD